jgi:Big-like domain-containing protein
MKGFIAVVILVLAVFSVNAEAATFYAAPAGLGGSEANDCTAAQSISTPKLRINSAIGCTTAGAGDTVIIRDGVYDEWLTGSVNGTLTPSAAHLSAQPFTQIIRNGASSANKTKIWGENVGSFNPATGQGLTGAIIAPTTSQNPDTNNAIGLVLAYTSNVHFKNLHLNYVGTLLPAAPNKSGGIFLGDAANIDIENVSLWRAGIKSSGGSSNFRIWNSHVGYSGEGCVFADGDPNTGGQPCPHGLYVCGDGHLIENNEVHHSSHSDIHITCETSNADNIIIRQNKIHDSKGYAVIVKGINAQVYSNVVERTGLGMFCNGNGHLYANNTVNGFFNSPSDVPDPFQFSYAAFVSSLTAVNNQFHAAKSSFNMIRRQDFGAISTSFIHHNMCSQSGNAGCTNVQTTSAIFNNYGASDYTLKSTSPARGAGVSTSATLDYAENTFASPPEIGAFAFVEADSIAPTVSLTAPAQGAIVSGAAISVTATASDNIGVSGVQFKLDGVALQAEDTSVPYGITWDTTTGVINGAHSLTATARDAAGNSTTSEAVLVTVSNSTGGPPSPVFNSFTCSGVVGPVYAGSSPFVVNCTTPSAP